MNRGVEVADQVMAKPGAGAVIADFEVFLMRSYT
jgi:hypothetical protein